MSYWFASSWLQHVFVEGLGSGGDDDDDNDEKHSGGPWGADRTSAGGSGANVTLGTGRP